MVQEPFNPVCLMNTPLTPWESETAYVFKYPVRKVCEGLEFWFIRQGGIYHKYASDSQKNTWLLIFPNADSLSPEAAVDIMTADKHPLAPHLALHFSHLVQWRWYMADFHAKLETAVSDNLFMHNSKGQG